MPREREGHYQHTRDVLFETNKDLKKHITPSPPEKVPMPVKREPNVPLWESEWKEGERVIRETIREANKRLRKLYEANREVAPEQDHTE